MCTGPLRKFQSGPVKFGRRGEEDRIGSDRVGSGRAAEWRKRKYWCKTKLRLMEAICKHMFVAVWVGQLDFLTPVWTNRGWAVLQRRAARIRAGFYRCDPSRQPLCLFLPPGLGFQSAVSPEKQAKHLLPIDVCLRKSGSWVERTERNTHTVSLAS